MLNVDESCQFLKPTEKHPFALLTCRKACAGNLHLPTGRKASPGAHPRVDEGFGFTRCQLGAVLVELIGTRGVIREDKEGLVEGPARHVVVNQAVMVYNTRFVRY